MPKGLKFTLNKQEFQAQVLYSPVLGLALAAALGADAEVEESNNARGKGRVRARVYGSLSDEASNGTLTRRLGGSKL